MWELHSYLVLRSVRHALLFDGGRARMPPPISVARMLLLWWPRPSSLSSAGSSELSLSAMSPAAAPPGMASLSSSERYLLNHEADIEADIGGH